MFETRFLSSTHLSAFALGDEDACRLFLFDLLFFKSPRNHLLLFVILDVWPEVFNWRGKSMLRLQPRGKEDTGPQSQLYIYPGATAAAEENKPQVMIDPLLETVVWVIFHTGIQSSKAELMVSCPAATKKENIEQPILCRSTRLVVG